MAHNMNRVNLTITVFYKNFFTEILFQSPKNPNKNNKSGKEYDSTLRILSA
jgi:hypothetical protein